MTMIVSVRNMKTLVSFLKGGLWLPVLLPWVLYRMIFSWNLKLRMRNKLQDKVVLITGASSGIGEALAHAFYKAGCKVILAARRTEELERVQRELLATSVNVIVHHPSILKLDLSDLKGIPQKAQEALNIHGRIDILINNGGVTLRGTAMDTTIDTDLKIMVTNYFGPISLTKSLLPSMIQNEGGHIVAVSSVQGKLAIPFRSSYAASKHAMQAFFDTLRAELSRQNIKVTVVSPGYVRTNLSVNAFTGNGAQYGVMDGATAAGMSPEVAATKIVTSVIQEDKDVVLSTCGPKLGILLRTLCPDLFFYLMSRKATEAKPHDN